MLFFGGKMPALNRYIDHTDLRAEATEADIRRLCAQAREYDFYAVCVNSSYVALCKEELTGTEVKIASVVGFPLGASHTAIKSFEAQRAIFEGAHEIDMVIHIGALKEGRKDYVLSDIKAVADAAHKNSALVKVILETCLLTDSEIATACQLSHRAGADFVKTSTGFSKKGADESIVRFMKETVKGGIKIKASGGIRDKDTALAMISAGADRIGTSSSVGIMQSFIY